VRLLVVSRMFPSERNPTSAIFFANFLRRLRPHLDDLLVVSPRFWFPFPLSRHPRFAPHSQVPVREKWHEIDVVRPPAPMLNAMWFRPFAGRLKQWTIGPAVRREHRSRRFDAVLGFGVLHDQDAAVGLGKALGIPSVVWAVGSDLNDEAALSEANLRRTALVLGRASLVVTVSQSLASRALEIAPGLRRVVPFYRGIDLDVFHSLPAPSVLRRELDLPAGHLVAMVGRIMRAKGIPEGVEVISGLRKRSEPVHLLLAGEDQLGATLDRLAREADVSDRVHRLGIQSHAETAKLLRAADVTLFASHREGLPNVPLESMAAETPVVTTRVGGVPEFARDGENTLLVEPGAVDSMRDAVARLLDDRSLAERIARGGIQTVRDRFDAKRNAADFAELLGTL